MIGFAIMLVWLAGWFAMYGWLATNAFSAKRLKPETEEDVEVKRVAEKVPAAYLYTFLFLISSAWFVVLPWAEISIWRDKRRERKNSA